MFDESMEKTINIPEIPSYIKDNLQHELRGYQLNALLQFMFTQEQGVADMHYKYSLFHMATGSGKTLVMAATILYLYQKHGYQNFVFFADSGAIITKTTENLTNPDSNKYLFNPNGIVIDGERIHIRVRDRFPEVQSKNTIYLILDTIQGVHGKLTEPVENGITFEALGSSDIVMLGDEAHHFFAETKSTKKKLTEEALKTRTWEKTIEKMLGLRLRNRMLGFSATLNLDTKNEVLYTKLADKIVYQYDLTEFMKEKYSKNVVLLQVTEDDETKMLHAVLLSQYRKYIAQDHGISLKPVVMFKAQQVKHANSFHKRLIEIIEGLSLSRLRDTIANGKAHYQNENSVWSKVFSYYDSKNLQSVIEDLKWDFNRETILNVNTKVFLSEQNALWLNTLEDESNPIRAIFQIAKLNEGWDVLNLYDIVRISEGMPTTISATDSEAQLIGRGARYYPFIHDGRKTYKRRFDTIDSDLKILETLHYHTVNQSNYIKNLNLSLDKAKVQVAEDGYERLQAKVKPSFKKTALFKKGYIYTNEKIPTSVEDYLTLNKYLVDTAYSIPLEFTIEKKYGVEKDSEVVSTLEIHEVKWVVERLYKLKATQRNPFYQFSNLKKYVPAVSSIDDFLDSESFLSDLTLYITLPLGKQLKDLSPMEKMKLLDKYFAYVAEKVKLNYKKEKGTTKFKGEAFSKYVKDYHLYVNKVRTNKHEQIIGEEAMGMHKWFVYDNALVNGTEKKMLRFIQRYVHRLKEEYDEVYLVRNEREVKITEIDSVRGFMPDFLLFLKDEVSTYQIFIEVKGGHLTEHDQWKQDFLEELADRAEVEIVEDKEIRLIGIKFYTDGNESEFREDFTAKLLGGSDDTKEMEFLKERFTKD